MKKWLAVLVGLLSLSVPAQVVIDNPVTDAVTLNGKPGSYYLASSSQLWAVRTNDTREIDLTGADLKVADSSASDHPVTRSELDAFRDEIGVTEFYFNTNSHPLVAASGRLQVTIPDACTYSPGALGAGTTVLKTFWLANATTRIRDGMYHTTCYARRTTGNSAAYMKWELLSSADSMATTNVLVTATNTQNILGSSFLPYETLKGLQDDTVGTNLYLGVRLSVVREAGGSGATIGFAGGVGNPAHLATPGIGDVSGYVKTAGDTMTGALSLLLPATLTNHAVRLGQMNASNALLYPKTGGNISGAVTMGSTLVVTGNVKVVNAVHIGANTGRAGIPSGIFAASTSVKSIQVCASATNDLSGAMDGGIFICRTPDGGGIFGEAQKGEIAFVPKDTNGASSVVTFRGEANDTVQWRYYGSDGRWDGLGNTVSNYTANVNAQQWNGTNVYQARAGTIGGTNSLYWTYNGTNYHMRLE